MFNHTGRGFFGFQDLLKNRAKSPYKDWYVVTKFDAPGTPGDGFTYKGWFGIKTLPIFASARDGHDIAPGPKEYIFNATAAGWMDPEGKGDPTNGIDGWRLDAAEQRPVEFWAEWNALVRRINPNAYTSAEIWTDPKDLIVNGGFSAVMNYYEFAIPVKGWLVDNLLPPTHFVRQTDDRRRDLPAPDAYAMQNMVDSHDTARLASMIVNAAGVKYQSPDKVEFNANGELTGFPKYSILRPDDRQRAVQRLVVLLQMTDVGAPMIYYGDEVGMWGASDPDDRQPMVWADLKYEPQTLDPRKGAEPPQPIGFDQEVYNFYHQAIEFRRTHPVLSRGQYQLVNADDSADTLAFARGDASNSLVVAFNRSDKPRTVLVIPPMNLRGALTKPTVLFSTAAPASTVEVTASDETLKISLPPLTGAVIGAGTP